MTESEFIANIKKVKGNRKHKASNSYGVNDAYAFYLNNSSRLANAAQFRAIIEHVNSKMANYISSGKKVELPLNMGFFEVSKRPASAKIIDGKVTATYAINWNDTLKLWNEDGEARKNKTLIRDIAPYVFRVRYYKARNSYENQSFVKFKTNRNIKLSLKENIKNNNIDAYLQYGD